MDLYVNYCINTLIGSSIECLLKKDQEGRCNGKGCVSVEETDLEPMFQP